MNRTCDAGGICAHIPQCDHFCHFTNAELETETRKVKPYLVIPDDIEPVSDTWQVIGSVMVGAVLAMLMVVCFALFFTGLWVWSLLI
jgi:hypothetical protein